MEKKKCSFCGGGVEPGTGKMFVKKDGSIYYFCSSKCESNMKLGRIPRRIKWAELSRKARGKEVKVA